MPQQTPKGVYLWITFFPLLSSNTSSGNSMSLNFLMQPTDMSNSLLLCASGLPCSSVRSRTNSSLYSVIASAKAIRAFCRSAIGVVDQGLKALRALATARSTSERVETGTSALGATVAGLMPWRVLTVEVSSLLMVLWKLWGVWWAEYSKILLVGIHSKVHLGDMAIGAIGGYVVCSTCCHLQGFNSDISGEENILGVRLKSKSGLERLVALGNKNTLVFSNCNEGLAEA